MPPSSPCKAHVIVVGGGLAGVSAAIEAPQRAELRHVDTD